MTTNEPTGKRDDYVLVPSPESDAIMMAALRTALAVCRGENQRLRREIEEVEDALDINSDAVLRLRAKVDRIEALCDKADAAPEGSMFCGDGVFFTDEIRDALSDQVD